MTKQIIIIILEDTTTSSTEKYLELLEEELRGLLAERQLKLVELKTSDVK